MKYISRVSSLVSGRKIQKGKEAGTDQGKEKTKKSQEYMDAQRPTKSLSFGQTDRYQENSNSSLLFTELLFHEEIKKGQRWKLHFKLRISILFNLVPSYALSRVADRRKHIYIYIVSYGDAERLLRRGRGGAEKRKFC